MKLLNSEQPLMKVTTLTTSMPFLPCFSAFSRFSLKKLMNIHFDLQFFLSAIRYLLDLPKKTALRVATELKMRKNKREDWHFLKLTTSGKEVRGNVYHMLILLIITTSEHFSLYHLLWNLKSLGCISTWFVIVRDLIFSMSCLIVSASLRYFCTRLRGFCVLSGGKHFFVKGQSRMPLS